MHLITDIFSDLLFGKCIPRYMNLENDDLYR